MIKLVSLANKIREKKIMNAKYTDVMNIFISVNKYMKSFLQIVDMAIAQ